MVDVARLSRHDARSHTHHVTRHRLLPLPRTLTSFTQRRDVQERRECRDRGFDAWRGVFLSLYLGGRQRSGSGGRTTLENPAPPRSQRRRFDPCFGGLRKPGSSDSPPSSTAGCPVLMRAWANDPAFPAAPARRHPPGGSLTASSLPRFNSLTPKLKPASVPRPDHVGGNVASYPASASGSRRPPEEVRGDDSSAPAPPPSDQEVLS